MSGRNQDTAIYVDCALLRKNTTITGISRVAYEYLRWFYAIAPRYSTTVIPVYATEDGIYDARYNLPEWTHDCPVFGRHHATVDASNQFTRRLARRMNRGLAAVSAPLAAFPMRAFGNRETAKRVRKSIRRWGDRSYLTRIDVRVGDVLFMPAWWHDEEPAHYLKLKSRGMVIVPLVHDVLPISMKEYYSPSILEHFRASVIAIMPGCTRPFYISDATRADVDAVLRTAGLPAVPGSVHHHGFDFANDRPHGAVRDEIKRLFGGRRKTILMVGSIEPKKNYLHAIREMGDYWRRGGDAQLVIIGRRAWMSRDILSAIENDPARGERLHWLSDASDAELIFAYQRTDLYLSASLAEGFGLPVIEALSHKRPIVLSDIPVFREIAGSHAAYFNLDEPGALAGLVEEVLTDPARLGALKEQAERFVWPRWEQVAEGVFQELLSLSDAAIRQSSPRSAA